MSGEVHLWGRDPASPEFPQSPSAVRSMTNDDQWVFAEECDYEPADPNACLACYSYLVAQGMSDAEIYGF